MCHKTQTNKQTNKSWRSPHGVMAKLQDNEFQLQSTHYVYFRTNFLGKIIETPYSIMYGYNSIIYIW